jgi:hypothetical protein
MDEAGARRADNAEQKLRKTSQGRIGIRKHSQVVPRIEIVFNRQQENVPGSATLEQLGAIRVSFPAHAAEQFAIGRAKRDQITTAPMVRTEDELLRRQLSEGLLDVERAKARAIPAHRDHFIVAELGDSFDRVLKTRREIMT